MPGFNSKYTGEKVEELLDIIPNIENEVNKHNKEVKFFCVEDVVVKVGDVEHCCGANQIATVFVGDEEFEIIPTSNQSIKSLLGYPIPLTWYDWLEGVDVFENIVFDMNELDTYKHWIQYHQNNYHVQKAQYSSCIFWSDKPYTHSPFEERTNYTLYYSAELPLCYSRIPENTYKPFYLAYGVKTDPNWNNPNYINSYSNVSGATQTFSYYGMSSIGIFDMAVHPIKLPKDCRGLMYHAPQIQHAGVFDASNTTNFGAKKGSWQEAFGDCISLTSLYIQNLKASINLSWSPINELSISYIVRNAANTSAITISVSPYTWYRLSDETKTTASEKNITIALLQGNMQDDSRWETTKVTESTVSGWGFTKNQGTVTNIVMNSSTKAPVNGSVNLGTIVTMSSCNGKDFNTIKTSGWYYGYQNMTNAAYPNSISVLEVIAYSTDWIVQRQTKIGNIDSSSTDTWERHFYNGNTWSKWAKVSNAQADWNTDNAVSASFIKNKPTIPNEALISSWGFQKNTEWVDVPVGGTTASDYYIEISNMQPNKVYVHSSSNKVKDIVINGFTKINEIGDIYTLIFTTSAELNASLSFSDSGDDYVLMFPDGTPPALEMDTTYELSIMRVVKNGTQQYHIIIIPFYKQLI